MKDPFVHNVFIENKGQFCKQEQNDVGGKILYSAEKGKLHLYFTATTVVFRYDSIYKIENDNTSAPDDESSDGVKSIRSKHLFLTLSWEGANSDADIEVQNPVSNYFTYCNQEDKSGQTGIVAHAWEKLIYHNLFNGIDVEFYFPDQNKGGIEYNIIAKPDANLNDIKMYFKGDKCSVSMINNDIHISSACINLIDHAPTATDESGNSADARFTVNNNKVSFAVKGYNKDKILTIDPWITSTSLGGVNKAYDLDYDKNGNVYVYGGGASVDYKLQKYNSAGVLQWTYTTPFSYQYSGAYFYGGFATDEKNGNSYITEGYDNGAGNNIVKVNNAGALVKLFTGNPAEDECWRLAYDYCFNEIIIGAGSNTSALQSAHIDTGLTTLTAFNAYSAGAPGHDVCLIAQDYGGKAYMATARSYPGSVPGILDNVMCQLPLPACTPTTYQVSDQHIFIEIGNVSYYPIMAGYAAGNGFNGMAADPNMVVTYDGGNMRKWRATNGTLLNTIAVSGTSYAWGGCDLDCDANIYLGNNTSIIEYDSNFVLKNTIAGSPGNVIYALKVFSARNVVYTAGNGFVQSTSIAVVCGPPLPCALVLPIQLLNFNCESIPNGIHLTWSTATETNNKEFTISRSTDGVNFQNIATIAGAGNSSVTQNYSYTDNPPLYQIYYYQLSQTDFDGHSVSFNITACNSNQQTEVVFPNPSSGNFSVSIDNQVSEIQVCNDIGQKIYDKVLDNNSGNILNLNLSSRPSGIYFLTIIKHNQNFIVKKLVIYPK